MMVEIAHNHWTILFFYTPTIIIIIIKINILIKIKNHLGNQGNQKEKNIFIQPELKTVSTLKNAIFEKACIFEPIHSNKNKRMFSYNFKWIGMVVLVLCRSVIEWVCGISVFELFNKYIHMIIFIKISIYFNKLITYISWLTK